MGGTTKRTRGPVLLLTSPLLLSLICEGLIARQTQGNDSKPVYQTIRDSVSVIAENDVTKSDDWPSKRARNYNNVSRVTLQTPDAMNTPRVYYFYEPFPMEVGSSILQIGASASLLPYPDSEQEIPIPGLDIQYKRGILENVSFVSAFSTSIFSNLLHTGLQWNSNLDRFSFGFANHVGFAYGFITRENLFDDVQAYAMFDMSLLRLGYRFDDFSFSSSFVISYVFKSMSYVNGVRASIGPEGSINDYYCTLVVEQPFLRNLRLSLGFSLGYARTPYQSWMLYNTVDEWLFVPEFFFAVQL